MFRLKKSTGFLTVLAAAWLVAQLLVAFHVGHGDTADSPSGATGLEHSCAVCKLAQLGDVLVATPFGFLLAVSFLCALPLAKGYTPAFRICLVRARAPPFA